MALKVHSDQQHQIGDWSNNLGYSLHSTLDVDVCSQQTAPPPSGTACVNSHCCTLGVFILLHYSFYRRVCHTK